MSASRSDKVAGLAAAAAVEEVLWGGCGTAGEEVEGAGGGGSANCGRTYRDCGTPVAVAVVAAVLVVVGAEEGVGLARRREVDSVAGGARAGVSVVVVAAAAIPLLLLLPVAAAAEDWNCAYESL